MPLLSVDELHRLRMPVTVVWGAHERLLPEVHLDFWRQLPDVEVLRPPAAHSPSYETPAWFEGMLRTRLDLTA
jgi:pimeloyl-ACP methyl ester carboxylesterase